MIIMSFCFIFSSFGTTAIVASSVTPVQLVTESTEQLGSDIKGHWAEMQLTKWIENGLLQGYSNGYVAPDRQITRGELVALINRSFGFKEKGEIMFTDLSAVDWQYEDVSIAAKEGYLDGYEDGTVRINNVINRQEAAVLLGRVLQPYFTTDSPKAAVVFKDADTIASWSKAIVQQLVDYKILDGYEDGSFKPLGLLTRAEAVTILDRALDWSAANKTTAQIFDQEGIYGSNEVAEVLTGDVVIATSGVILLNTTITGDLLLAEGIGEGDVVLDHVTVLGQTAIKGGGVNSVHIRDSDLNLVIIDKRAGTVRIVLEGDTRVETIVVYSSSIIESSASSVGGFTDIQVSEQLMDGGKVTIRGDFANVDVEASNSVIEFVQGVIDRLTIHVEAKNVQLITEKDSKIILLLLNNIVRVLGQGMIDKAIVNEQARGTTFEKRPEQLEGAGIQEIEVSSPGADGEGETSLPPIKIIQNGQANAAVLVDGDANEQVLNAASTFVEYVQKSTGVELPIQTVEAEGLKQDIIHIYIGTSFSGDQQLISNLLKGMTGDGFVIVPRANTITIVGPTAWGTEFGVYEFLERYVGVRWLLPGPDGEDVPERQTISVPLNVVKDEPVAISRQFFGTETITTNEFSIPSSNTEWARHNRIYENIQFHHNMHILFDPEVFSEHPEYYPGGEMPTSKNDWQPCLNDVTAEAAATRIIEFFNQNPETTSYSLGLNDSLKFLRSKTGAASRS